MLQTLVGVVALEEEKKAEPKGLGKRDWGGREGRVARWRPCQQKWRSQKGKLA